MQARKLRILAVDHNPLLREGLSLLIQLQPDMELVGVVASADQAVESFKEHRPDVTLMDLDLPSETAIAAIQEILRIEPAACVVGLFTYEGDKSGGHALRAGAAVASQKTGCIRTWSRWCGIAGGVPADRFVPAYPEGA